MWAHTATAHYPTLIRVLAPLKIIRFIFEKNGGLYVKRLTCSRVFLCSKLSALTNFCACGSLSAFLGAKPKHQTKPVNKSPLTKPQKSDTTKTSRWAFTLSITALIRVLPHPFRLFNKLLGVTFKGLIDVLLYCLIPKKKIELKWRSGRFSFTIFHALVNISCT